MRDGFPLSSPTWHSARESIRGFRRGAEENFLRQLGDARETTSESELRLTAFLKFEKPPSKYEEL